MKIFLSTWTIIILSTSAMARAESAPLKRGEPIPGQFIVTVDPNVSPEQVAGYYGITPRFIYKSVMNGFSGKISDSLRVRMKEDRGVVAIEQDSVVTANSFQDSATWGIDRLDQRALPLDQSFNTPYAGRGVTAYIIDTGIRYDHLEFRGRATRGFDAFGGTGADCYGHGTHVAGTVGGEIYGVAKDVRLVSVRVLDCSGSGTVSGVVAGIDWIIAQRNLPAVANLSLGGGASSSLDAAIRKMISAGVVTAVAAGNESQDACNTSPARVLEAMTIGASDSTDRKAPWSNFGSCVDWFAPGVDISSAWLISDSAIAALSGTSMATPHTAGVAALYLEHFPTASPQAVRNALYAFATKGIIASAKTPNNHLLHSNESPTADDTIAPKISINQPVSGTTVRKRSIVSITATATDNTAVTRVDFYVNGKQLCRDTISPYACSWRVPGGSSKRYQLTAVARDINDNRTISQTVTVTSR